MLSPGFVVNNRAWVKGVTETAGQKILNFEIVLLEVMYK